MEEEAGTGNESIEICPVIVYELHQTSKLAG